MTAATPAVFLLAIAAFAAADFQLYKEITTFSQFDLDLAKSLNKNAGGNWVTSPASIKSALGLLLEGAAGNSAVEICKILRLPEELSRARSKMHDFQKNLKDYVQHPEVETKVANRIFTKKGYPINPKFKEEALEHYKAEAQEADFSNPLTVSNEINSWVSEKTNNFVTEIIKPDDIQPTTVLLLLNAVYFKGTWKYGFNKDFTRAASFHTAPGTTKKVDMMASIGMLKSGPIDNLKASIIEIPYKNPQYSMVILLPDSDTSLENVLPKLDYKSIELTLGNLREQETDLRLPKFSISYNIELVPILQALGIQEIFSDNADLSDLLKDSQTKVTNIIHQAKIDVSENGTIAGAATAVNVQLLSVANRQKFIANRPFLFFIRDSKSGFLFVGQIVDPSQKKETSHNEQQKVHFDETPYVYQQKTGPHYW